MSLNYDEIPFEQLRINKASRDVILQYQKHQRMMLNFDASGREPEDKQVLPDEYLISVFDPLASTKFVDPHAADKGTRDLNQPQLRAGTGIQEARNLTKI